MKDVETAVMQKAEKNNESSGSSSDVDKEEEGDKTYAHRDGVVMRKPRGVRKRQEVFTRRITCHDLGQGTCEGWLLKRREIRPLVSKRWMKMFFKLKEFVLYYYMNKEADKATGVICLAGYSVEHSNKRKWAMRIFHKVTGKEFYIAAERQSDWDKWIKHIQLAATIYASTDKVRNSRIFSDSYGDSPPSTDAYSGYHSESDDDEDEEQGFTREFIVDRVSKSSALKRTIEAKRKALKEMNKLLLAKSITSESIRAWRREHPELLQDILSNPSRTAKRERSMSDESEGGIVAGYLQHVTTGTMTSPATGTTTSPALSKQVRSLNNIVSCLGDEEKNKIQHERCKELLRRRKSIDRTQSEDDEFSTRL